ncbi:MAG: hypothetical protein ABIK98_03300 [Pseudomonadota bacterium]|uniref:Universal stress protein n=1 Tax=Candidatus Desulfatibia profunda TaxID=2841695 RepID=A0A8J6NSN5_9BACT|nr:hypothetical protein [Candidatus Desulfatibia profunda]MBL7178589.1 hypothetical protein [Desulfobacterales bacterium]
MSGIFGKIKRKVNRLTGKMDRYQEAITFAEAGQPEYAREFTPEEMPRESDKLLVIGRESTFSREIIDYALEMAKRMSYEIVALNTAPLSCDTFKLFSSSRDKICQDFKDLSANNARLFQEEAAREGIPFSHVIKFSETDEAVESLRKEFGEVAFVVSESIEQAGESRVEEGERLERKLFVYSMV